MLGLAGRGHNEHSSNSILTTSFCPMSNLVADGQMPLNWMLWKQMSAGCLKYSSRLFYGVFERMSGERLYWTWEKKGLCFLCQATLPISCSVGIFKLLPFHQTPALLGLWGRHGAEISVEPSPVGSRIWRGQYWRILCWSLTPSRTTRSYVAHRGDTSTHTRRNRSGNR